MNVKVGFIGGGNMAEAFINAFVNGEFLLPSQIIVSDVSRERLNYLEENYGVKTAISNVQVVNSSDVIFLAVKPQVLSTVLEEIKEAVTQAQVVVSMAAGYSIKKIEAVLGDDKKIVRIMPNILVKIRKGVVAYCDNHRLIDKERTLVKELLSSCALVLDVGENLFDGVTAISGSGPAFFFLILEAIADGGVKAGLPRELAVKLAAETMAGAAEIVKGGNHPEVLKDSVTSPAGTTIEGLFRLEERGVRYAFMKAVEDAARRSSELSKFVEKF